MLHNLWKLTALWMPFILEVLPRAFLAGIEFSSASLSSFSSSSSSSWEFAFPFTIPRRFLEYLFFLLDLEFELLFYVYLINSWVNSYPASLLSSLSFSVDDSPSELSEFKSPNASRIFLGVFSTSLGRHFGQNHSPSGTELSWGRKQYRWWPRSHLSHRSILSASRFFLHIQQRAFSMDLDQAIDSSRVCRWMKICERVVQLASERSQASSVLGMAVVLPDVAPAPLPDRFDDDELGSNEDGPRFTGVLVWSPRGMWMNRLSTDCSIWSRIFAKLFTTDTVKSTTSGLFCELNSKEQHKTNQNNWNICIKTALMN